MPKRSAGLVMYRIRDGQMQVLLVHFGGPLWAKKDKGAWSIPKGEVEPDEDSLAAAKREFEEETGIKPEGEIVPLGTIRQKSGKTVSAWAWAGDFDLGKIKSNFFSIEWPPRSGKQQQFPEIDRAEFFTLETAKEKIIAGEFELLQRLADIQRTAGLANQKSPAETSDPAKEGPEQQSPKV